MKDPTAVLEIKEGSKGCVIVSKILLKEVADLILLALVY
jgi:hypothetical protein